MFGCRNVQFFGEEGQLKVHKAFVVVVGLGGVGSHAAAMLLRSGVGKLRLIDFDQVPSQRVAYLIEEKFPSLLSLLFDGNSTQV